MLILVKKLLIITFYQVWWLQRGNVTNESQRNSQLPAGLCAGLCSSLASTVPAQCALQVASLPGCITCRLVRGCAFVTNVWSWLLSRSTYPGRAYYNDGTVTYFRARLVRNSAPLWCYVSTTSNHSLSPATLAKNMAKGDKVKPYCNTFCATVQLCAQIRKCLAKNEPVERCHISTGRKWLSICFSSLINCFESV